MPQGLEVHARSPQWNGTPTTWKSRLRSRAIWLCWVRERESTDRAARAAPCLSAAAPMCPSGAACRERAGRGRRRGASCEICAISAELNRRGIRPLTMTAVSERSSWRVSPSCTSSASVTAISVPSATAT